MTHPWTNWKRFPDPQRGGLIEAPIGPGVYEVRRMSDGELVAFGSATNVAQALAGLQPHGASKWWLSSRTPKRVDEFEYRIWSTVTKMEAKTVADSLRGRRHVFWRRRAGWRLAGDSAA
jgi:hypothetical protein